MLVFLIRRLLEMVFVLLGVTLIVFLMIHMIPGDPALLVAGLEASPETVERIRHQLGLDRPLYVQFARYLTSVIRGDLGVSIRTGAPVAREIGERIPYTLAIAVGGTMVAIVLGMLAGVVAAVYHNRFGDGFIIVISLLAVSTPSYWLGLMLMLVFSLSLGLLPSIGIASPAHYVLPVATLGAQSGGMIARMTRAAMLDVLRQDYVVAARSKGLSESAVILKHALSNALIPVISLVGLRFGIMLSGMVLVEAVFAIPGVGRMIVDAVLARDYPMIQGAILVVAAMFVLVNTVTDLFYGMVDPRIRFRP